MGGLTSHGDLSVAQLAFFGPALLVGIAVNIKQGFSGGLSWIYLCSLSILRIIGASVTVYMETNNDYSEGLEETAFITSAIGTMPLLLVLLGILSRLHTSMGPNGITELVFLALHLGGAIALALSIVGGTKIQDSDPSSHNTGKDCLEAGSIIFVVLYLGLALITMFTVLLKRKYILSAEKVLLFAAVGVCPELAVRIAYTVAVSWSSNPGSSFYYLSPSVAVTAGMQFAMEAICVIIYSWGGLTAPKVQTSRGGSNNTYRGEPGPKMEYDNSSVGAQEAGYAGQHSPPQGRPQRSIGDYRPSRMLRNSMRN